jgi:chitosanase
MQRRHRRTSRPVRIAVVVVLAAVPLAAVVTAGVGNAAPVAAARPAGVGLDDPHKKEIAMELVSSAENSSLDWKAQYKYIEDIHDGRGYTAGIIGFCSGTGDMLELVQHYT